MKIKILILSFLALALSSCIPEETPITPIDRGDLTSAELTLSMYDYSIYFSLESGQFVKEHSQFNWIMAFDCSSDEHGIRLNSGKTVKARMLDTKDFASVREEDVPDSLFIDNPNGEISESVFGRWWEESNLSNVFIIKGGITERRRPDGTYKVQLELINNTIQLRVQEFGDEEKTVIIEKDENKNFVHIHLKEPEVLLDNEPNKNSYDLVFEARTEFVPLSAIDEEDEDTAVQYQVRGVYLNPNGVEATKFENLDSLEFLDIEYDNVSMIELSSAENAIGYDWKSINLDENLYSVENDYYYIIKSLNGFFYKMRFIKFYNDSGERGFPEFEYKQL